MLSRFISRPLHLRSILTLIASSKTPIFASPLPHHSSSLFPPPNPNLLSLLQSSRSLSADRSGGDDGGTWNLTPEAEDEGSVFGEEEGNLAGIAEGVDDVFGRPETDPAAAAAGSNVTGGDLWSESEPKGDIFDEINREVASKKHGQERGGDDDWETAQGYKPWSIGDDEEGRDVFGIGEGEEGIEGIGGDGIEELEDEGAEEKKQLEEQEQQLLAKLKGPNRAFGDLIAASGITEDMIDSLILLKDVRGVKGLPPLSEIEDKAIARMNATSTRGEIERRKQEEIARSRVRQVDEKGRAYGTGRRKCSIARVWIRPGDGKFIVNDKQFDVYFPIMDHRATLLQPFNVTKTLGLWDVDCTVKGGGVSGQVGAIRLGISKALQCWEPGLRPYLKSAGYLTRDPRVVERKKPGKAKARKSFQWVKR